MTPNKKFVYAVNGGDNTIAAFSVKKGLELEPIKGSPFYSRGVAPISLTIVGDDILVVANRNDDPKQITYTKTQPANYVSYQN